MCRGHFHAPGTLVPLSQFHVHRSGVRKGKPFSRCKRCWDWQRKHPKLLPGFMRTVPVEEFRPVIEELRRRIGPVESARRIGMSVEHLSDKRLADKSSVRGSTYDAAVKVLEEARASGEDGWDVVAARSRNLTAKGRNGYLMERAKFERECERRRTEGKLVKGALGPIRLVDLFTMAECQAYWRRGFKVPLDLVPHEYWHPPDLPFPRFSEEMLGDEF